MNRLFSSYLYRPVCISPDTRRRRDADRLSWSWAAGIGIGLRNDGALNDLRPASKREERSMFDLEADTCHPARPSSASLRAILGFSPRRSRSS